MDVGICTQEGRSVSHSARLTVNLIVNLFSRGMDSERDDGAATRTSEPGPSGSGGADRLEAQMARMIAEMQQMREDLVVGQEEAASKLARSSRRDPYSFCRKGNENQYLFCEDVEERLETTSAAIARAERGAGREALARAKEAAKEDVMGAGVWPLLKDLEVPELRRLAQSLPATVPRSRADSTTKKYLGAYQRWKTWAEARCEVPVPAFPVKDIHLALYLKHLSESVQSRAAVEEAVHALSWLHEVAGLESVGMSPIVQATLAGLRCMLARPKSRKEPVTADMLKDMVEAAGMDVRLLAMCLVAFAGFLRCDELIKLRYSDIVFNTESMVIMIVGSKTNQYREGSSLIVARTGTVTCPVGMMERYFAMGGLECTSHEHVFRAISKTKLGEKLRKGGGLSYSRARELLLEKIKSMGMDPALFGMHSLRAGGATAAAN